MNIPAEVTIPDSTCVEGPWSIVGAGRLPERGVYICSDPATMTVDGDKVTCASVSGGKP